MDLQLMLDHHTGDIWAGLPMNSIPVLMKHLGELRSSMIVLRTMPVTLLLMMVLCSCSDAPKPSEPMTPPAAHLVTSEGTPVSGAPEPEVVQLEKIETTGTEKRVTVGNVAGEYVLVCNEDANNEEHGIRSCLSPRPQQDYLLFRANTRWLINGAKEPVNLKFMQDWSVAYNRGENIGLLPAKKSDAEQFGVYWLMSWTGKNPAH